MRRTGITRKAGLLFLASLAVCAVGPSAARATPSPPPFKLWAPWAPGLTDVLGSPGNFWGQGDHKDNDYYAVDINGVNSANNVTTDCGQEIRATAAGTVIFAGNSGGPYGIEVVIDHGGGYTSRYAHLQDVTVSVGQAVLHWTPIGHMGSTGNSTGCHLHFVVYLNGVSVPNSPLSNNALFNGITIKSDNTAPTLAMGDLNGDGVINIVDLSIMAAHWGQWYVGRRNGDLNLDGTVNITDLSIIARNWG